MSKTHAIVQLAAAGLLLVLLILSDFGLFFPVRDILARIFLHLAMLTLISHSLIRLILPDEE